MEVTRCSVPVETRAPEGTANAYVLGRDPAVLVDPAGRTAELDHLVRTRGVEHVLVTHTHPDHVGAVDQYVSELEATAWARAGRTDQFREATGVDPERTFSPGTALVLDEPIYILDTPGHASDHVAFVAGQGGPILCGDCAVRDRSVVVGAPDGDMRAYLTTLRRLRVADTPALLPGHGPPITDPTTAVERLLAHRLERERSVREAVERGGQTLEEILEFAYGKDLSGVADLARTTVDAHLEKLSVEGALEWDGERAQWLSP